jgi:hypothetical protein
MRALVMGLVFAAAIAAQTANYFPLTVGNRWEYAADGEKNHRVMEVLATERVREKTWFRLRWFDGGEVRLRGDAESRLLSLAADGKEESVWEEFTTAESAEFESHVSPCTVRGLRMTSESVGLLQVGYVNLCNDAGIRYDVFADAVGLRERGEITYAGLVVWKLVSARIGGREMTF